MPNLKSQMAEVEKKCFRAMSLNATIQQWQYFILSHFAVNLLGQPEAEVEEEDGDGEDNGNLEWFDPDPGQVNKSWRNDLAKARKAK